MVASLQIVAAIGFAAVILLIVLNGVRVFVVALQLQTYHSCFFQIFGPTNVVWGLISDSILRALEVIAMVATVIVLGKPSQSSSGAAPTIMSGTAGHNAVAAAAAAQGQAAGTAQGGSAGGPRRMPTAVTVEGVAGGGGGGGLASAVRAWDAGGTGSQGGGGVLTGGFRTTAGSADSARGQPTGGGNGSARGLPQQHALPHAPSEQRDRAPSSVLQPLPQPSQGQGKSPTVGSVAADSVGGPDSLV
jgi:hypothetical protein